MIRGRAQQCWQRNRRERGAAYMQSLHPQRMPVVFIGHGSPMNTLESNRYTEVWRRLGRALPRPRAILAVSAHWYTGGVGVTAMAEPRTIHDFGGFPQALFDVQYPAPGDPALAAWLRDLLQPLPVALDHDWGLDHGTWSVLAHLFPEANIPVLQLSIDATQPAQFHYDLAHKLALLRDAGVLILGSGNVVHNLGVLRGGPRAPAYHWAETFNQQVREHVVQRRHQPLIDYAGFGEAAQLSIPTPEHYLPLLYVLGLQRHDDVVSIPTDGIELGSISMLSVVLSDVSL